MIFTVPLQPGTLLSRVRYKWIVAGVAGSAQSTGISQPDASFPLFRISSTPPDGAEELYVYDNLDSSNWNTADYFIAAEIAGAPGATSVFGRGVAASFRDDVLWAVTRRLGYEPTTDLLVDQAAAYVSYINDWVRRSWDTEDWPEWTVIEHRDVTADNYVETDPGGAPAPTPIGRVLRVYTSKPSESGFAPGAEIRHRRDVNGIYVGKRHGDMVWVKFMLRPPRYTSEIWDSTLTYAANALVYDPVTGECYFSVQAGNTNHAVTDPTWWTNIPFPASIVDQVVRGAVSDGLREDKDYEDGATEEQASDTEKIDRKSAGYGLLNGRTSMTEQNVRVSRYHPAAA